MADIPAAPSDAPNWFYTWVARLTTLQYTQQDVILEVFTVLEMPAAANLPYQMKYCSNEAGGAVPVFSDGTNWRRVTDRAVMS